MGAHHTSIRLQLRLCAQDSALDSLVAARHAVLADLAADVAAAGGAAGGSGAEAGTPMSHQASRRLLEAREARGNAGADVPALDPLMQARALVRALHAHAHVPPTCHTCAPLECCPGRGAGKSVRVSDRQNMIASQSHSLPTTAPSGATDQEGAVGWPGASWTAHQWLLAPPRGGRRHGARCQ